MKRISPRWACLVQPPCKPRSPSCLSLQQKAPFSHETGSISSPPSFRPQHNVRPQWQKGKRPANNRRSASSAAVAQLEDDVAEARFELKTPSHRRALRSPKLAALHARLSLPSKFPLQTLGRCLVDPSADGRPGYNNAPFAVLGSDLLGYYTAEWLMCHYPRLPMPILFAAQYAYVGPATLAAMRAEWGVELVAAPGPEVDPGLLQLTRVTPGNALSEDGQTRVKNLPSSRRINASRKYEEEHWRRGMSSRIVYDDQFGEVLDSANDAIPYPGIPISTATSPGEGDSTVSTPPMPSLDRPNGPQASTVEAASASFIRALLGALYLHAGTAASKTFHKDHVLSRHLPLHKLFNFTYPTRDLSRLCAREGFEPPVARLLSETGRHSRTPVYVVGVFSGNDKLGEGAGGSLNEGRVRAAAAALRSWYLYSPPESEIMLPSETMGDVGSRSRKEWKPQLIDMGEVVT